MDSKSVTALDSRIKKRDTNCSLCGDWSLLRQLFPFLRAHFWTRAAYTEKESDLFRTDNWSDTPLLDKSARFFKTS